MKEKEYPFKIGQKVKLLNDGTSVTNSKFNRGAKLNNIVIITHIVPEGGSATIDDPRYCGNNFNVRGEDLEAIVENTKPEDKELLIGEKGLESVLVGNEALTTCYIKFKLGDHIKSPKETTGIICSNVYRIHNNGNIYTNYDIDGTLHPIMLWSSRNNEYAEIINDTIPINLYNEKDQESICDTCESHYNGINRKDCEGSKCSEATEIFYEQKEEECIPLEQVVISSIGHKEPLGEDPTKRISHSIVKSPEQIKHKNWLDFVHGIDMIPVGHSAWEQLNTSKMRVHNNSDQLISAGLALMSKSLSFKKSSPIENKIIIPNEPIEIFIKRKK